MPASALGKHTGASKTVLGAACHCLNHIVPAAAPKLRCQLPSAPVHPLHLRPPQVRATGTQQPASMALLTESGDITSDVASVIEQAAGTVTGAQHQQQQQQRRPRRFVGDACPMAGEFHSSDFDWHEHAAACVPLLRLQEEQAASGAAAGPSSSHLPNDNATLASRSAGVDGSSNISNNISTSTDNSSINGGSASRAHHSTSSTSRQGAQSTYPPTSTSTPISTPNTSPTHPDDAKWEVFYRQHPRARFFKQRRYLLLEFPALQTARHVIELGCGCGSSLLPVLTANPQARATAFDVSATSVQQLIDAAAAAGIGSERIDTFVADAADASLAAGRLLNVGADAALIMYTLSAVMPDRMVAMLRNAYAALAPGGVLMLRDHGLYDMVQLRIPPHQRLGPNLYRRDDGTLAYFFTTQELSSLAQIAGFDVVECSYICVINHNRKTGQKLRRVFVHGVFHRPIMSACAGLADAAGSSVK